MFTLIIEVNIVTIDQFVLIPVLIQIIRSSLHCSTLIGTSDPLLVAFQVCCIHNYMH